MGLAARVGAVGTIDGLHRCPNLAVMPLLEPFAAVVLARDGRLSIWVHRRVHRLRSLHRSRLGLGMRPSLFGHLRLHLL